MKVRDVVKTVAKGVLVSVEQKGRIESLYFDESVNFINTAEYQNNPILSKEVVCFYPEYYKGAGKFGITIIIQ